MGEIEFSEEMEETIEEKQNVKINTNLIDFDKIYSTLYYDETGSANAITLKDNLLNYKYIEIYYYTNTDFLNSKKVLIRKDKKKITLTSKYKGGALYVSTISTYNLNNNTITPLISECGYYVINGTAVQMNWDNTNYSFIYKIIGYK